MEWTGEAPASLRWNGAHYRVITSAGPWRASGDWWDVDGWARDEWDVALGDGTDLGLVDQVPAPAGLLWARAVTFPQ